MTTPAAKKLYEAQHVYDNEMRLPAVFNPHSRPLSVLPTIFGFNNGSNAFGYSAQLLAEDGTPLGSHACSSEAYMPHDLGILEGTRLDRHEDFKKHYPDGYRMEFVGYEDVPKHAALNKAFAKNDAKEKKEQK